MHIISTYEEKAFLLLLQQGDEYALEKIYKIYSSRLYGSLLKLVKSETEAQEILQDVFIQVWDNRQSIDVEKSFRSWLFKIAENKVYDLFRKIARDKKRADQLMAIAISAYSHIEEDFLKKENMAILQKAIESLPPQRQQVFRLCKLEGKSYKEVSELLGITVSTISDHIVKATKSIRDHFANNEQSLLAFFALSFAALM